MSVVPTVSVILLARPGAPSLAPSLDSMRAQTLRPLDIIVAGDDPHGASRESLAAGGGDRVVLLRNDPPAGEAPGQDAALRRCLSQARGAYVAFLAQGDLSQPTRLAREVACLAANTEAAAVATTRRVLSAGMLARGPEPAHATPGVVDWLLMLGRPPSVSSLMVRATALAGLPVSGGAASGWLDLWFHARRAGAILRLDMPLTITRPEAAPDMAGAAGLGAGPEAGPEAEAEAIAAVLRPSYAPIFAGEAEAAAGLVARHLALGWPVPDAASLARVKAVFDRLNAHFLDGASGETALQLRAEAARLWEGLQEATAAAGTVRRRTLFATNPQAVPPSLARRVRALAASMAPRKAASLAAPPAMPRQVPPAAPGQLYGRLYHPVTLDPCAPPRLFAVVDTEAEFDWDKPFARELTSTHAMDFIGRGQAVFDTYGLRPIYVIDYPVATQEGASACLRVIHARGGCEIGAHLHPWTTPPFEEDVSNRNSYPGNLDPAIEARKLAQLVEAIRAAFGAPPRFYKAGRYGFGPTTTEALIAQGIAVDLSILPGADLRFQGGPDFRGLQAIPYRIEGTNILAMPMTRASIGLVPWLARLSPALHRLPGGARIPLAPLLARLRLADTITLTPEGVTTQEQIRMLRVLLARGCRHFVLHYHSPSLGPGNTPYARDAEGAETMLRRLDEVCRFFFCELGGLPGDPADLVRILG